MSQIMTRQERLLSEASVKEGWLTKRALKSGRNWKKRWFVLTREAISYYERPGGKKKGVQVVRDALLHALMRVVVPAR